MTSLGSVSAFARVSADFPSFRDHPYSSGPFSEAFLNALKWTPTKQKRLSEGWQVKFREGNFNRD